MLRSAEIISITSPSYQNYNGYLLAPAIEINGLVLRADQAIPPVVAEFIESKGGTVSIVTTPHGERLIKLLGEFNIPKQEIEQFLESNFEIAVSQIANTEPLPSAPLLKNTWENSFALEIEQGEATEESFSDSHTTVTVRPFQRFNLLGHEIRSSGDEIKIRGNARFYTKGDNVLEASNIECDGLKFKAFKQRIPTTSGSSNKAGIDVGLFAEFFSFGKNTFNSTQTTKLQNCAVTSGDKILINTGPKGNFCLRIDTNCEWLNNPHKSEFLGFLNHTPGTVYKIEEVASEEEERNAAPRKRRSPGLEGL